MATTTIERPAVTAATEPVLTVDWPALEEWLRERDQTEVGGQAAFLGLDPATLWRVRTGARGPGNSFIARVLTADPTADPVATFGRIFRVHKPAT